MLSTWLFHPHLLPGQRCKIPFFLSCSVCDQVRRILFIVAQVGRQVSLAYRSLWISPSINPCFQNETLSSREPLQWFRISTAYPWGADIYLLLSLPHCFYVLFYLLIYLPSFPSTALENGKKGERNGRENNFPHFVRPLSGKDSLGQNMQSNISGNR